MLIKKILVAFFLTLFVFSNSQVNYNWYPIRPVTNYNFTTDTSVTISNVIKIDSSSANTFFYLNKIIRFCDTCKNSNLLNDLSDSTYFLNAQPQFLNHYFKFFGGNQFYFPGKNAFTIKVNVPVGHVWLYDTLNAVNASVISKHVQLILGISDSVEVIKLSSNDTIIISKQFGIVQFPFKTISKHKYTLTGTEGLINYGTKLKTFHDFFNFNVGDVIQYEITDNDYNFFPPLFTHGAEKWQFLSVTNYVDSVVCEIKKIYFDSAKFGNNSPAITSYTQTITKTFIDSAKHLSNLYPLQEINVSPYSLYINGIKYIHKINITKNAKNRIVKQFGENCPNTYLTSGNFGVAEETVFKNIFIIRNSKKIIGRQITEGLGFTSEVFNDYDRVYKKCAIGYIKGTDTSGVIYWPSSLSGIEDLDVGHKISIYPNPADGFVSVYTESIYPIQIKLLDLTGKEILNTKINSSSENINVKNISNGIYFIVISTNNFSKHTKLLIEH